MRQRDPKSVTIKRNEKREENPTGANMAPAYHVTIAERKDIAAVTVLCDECETRVCFQSATAKVPESCPSCGKPFSDKTKSALCALARFHRDAMSEEANSGKSLFRFEIRESV